MKTKMLLTKTLAPVPPLRKEEILDRAPALVYVFDYSSLSNVYCNEGLIHTLGYDADFMQSLGANLRAHLYHPEDYKIIGRHDCKIKALKPNEVYAYTTRFLCADGAYRWFVVRVKPYAYNDLGQLTQVVGLCATLMEQDNLYKRLAAEELRFRAIYNSTTDLNVFVDQTFHLIAINHTAQRYVQKYYRHTLQPGDSVLQILPARWGVQVRQCLRQALGGQNGDVQLSYTTLAGSVITFRFRFFPVRADDGETVGVNVNASNISRLSAATRKVETQSKQLRHIAQLNAHEIRRPLTNILGIIHLLGLEYPGEQLPSSMRHLLEALKRSGDDLDHVIRTIVETAAE